MSENIEVDWKKLISGTEYESFSDEKLRYEDRPVLDDRSYSSESSIDEDDLYECPSDAMPQLLEYFFNVQNPDQSSTETAIDFFRGKFDIEWLNSCVSELSNSDRGFDNLSDTEKGNLIIDRFLFSDMKSSCAGGGGVLPKNVDTLHDVNLPGPFVLQVNEIFNTSVPPEDRFQDVRSGFTRCLKLSMTDGVQCVAGYEHKPIRDLRVSSRAGLKVLIEYVNVRHGCLMLVPEGLKILGGMVEALEAERITRTGCHQTIDISDELLTAEEMDDAPSVWRCMKPPKKASKESKERNKEMAYDEAMDIKAMVSRMFGLKREEEFVDDVEEIDIDTLEREIESST